MAVDLIPPKPARVPDHWAGAIGRFAAALGVSIDDVLAALTVARAEIIPAAWTQDRERRR